MRVLAVSYGRDLFDPESRVSKRMQYYAEALDEYYMIVFTLQAENIQGLSKDNLTIVGTNSKWRFLMPLDAFLLGYKVLRKESEGRWVISCQDPIMTGLIGYVLHLFTRVVLHVQVHTDIFSPLWLKDSVWQPVRLKLAWFVLRRADSVRVVSERIARVLRLGGVEEPTLSVIPIQGDLSDFLDASSSLKWRSQFRDDSVVALTVSRLEEEKNLPMLLKAAKIVASKDLPVQFVIVGKGSKEESLKSLSSELGISGSVTFLPWSNDVAAMMASADMYVLPSKHEGWGMVIAESMSAGTPVVTTAVGAAGELMIDGEHGIVVPEVKAESLAEGIIDLSKDADKRERYGIAAKARIQAWHKNAFLQRASIISSIKSALD